MVDGTTRTRINLVFQFTAQPSIIKAPSAECTRWIRLVDENYKLTYFIRIMASLRTSNRYLAEKNAGQISQQIKVRAYDSSVFEGVRLRRGHALAALSIASRKKTAKAR